MRHTIRIRSITLMVYLFLFILCFALTTKAEDQLEVLYSFTDPARPLTYYHSDEPVLIPKEPKEYKYYFKAAYVLTRDNLDFPRMERTSSQDMVESFKQAYKKLLDTFMENHINVIIFEIRPLLDAFYPSSYNPWSQFLIGTEGQFVEDWDPLAFMIEEAHARRMEFHGYVNAFLVSNEPLGGREKEAILSTLSASNFARNHEEYVFVGADDRLYLNPAEQTVIDHFLQTVEELITGYDLDALHLDTSFYPSGGFVGNLDYQLLTDEEKAIYQTVEQYRVEQVNNLLDKLERLMNRYKPSMQLGMTIHDDAPYIDESRLFYYADYIIPKLNARFESAPKGYADLLREWAEKFTVSQSVQRMRPNLYIGFDPHFESHDYKRELESYFRLHQLYDEIQGVAFYGLPALADHKDYPTFQQVMTGFYASAYFLPPVPVFEAEENLLPAPAFEVKRVNGGIQISWSHRKQYKNLAKYYVLYRVKSTDELIPIEEILHPDHIVKIFLNDPTKDSYTYIDYDVKNHEKYKYALTVIDRANRETELPYVIDYDLSIATNQAAVIALFIITSVIGLAVIVISSYRVLKD